MSARRDDLSLPARRGRRVAMTNVGTLRGAAASTSQQMTQPFDFFFSRGAGARTARIASSKTFLRPFCVSAEHSRYLCRLSASAHIQSSAC